MLFRSRSQGATNVPKNPDATRAGGLPVQNSSPATSSLPSGNLLANVKSPARQQYGIVIGKALQAKDAKAAWRDLSAKIGMLLIGLVPRVSDPQQDGKNRIIAGPIDDYSEAEMLCGRIIRVGIDCLPVRYETGTLLPL